MFDQDITGWSTPAGINVNDMFRNACAFKAKFTRTDGGKRKAAEFGGTEPLALPDVSQMTNLENLFGWPSGWGNFQEDLSAWDRVPSRTYTSIQRQTRASALAVPQAAQRKMTRRRRREKAARKHSVAHIHDASFCLFLSDVCTAWHTHATATHPDRPETPPRDAAGESHSLDATGFMLR